MFTVEIAPKLQSSWRYTPNKSNVLVEAFLIGEIETFFPIAYCFSATKRVDFILSGYI